MVELRQNIPGFYKGLIFCRGLHQAKRVKNSLDISLKEIFNEKTSSVIKRGCSEYPLKFPEYGKITHEPQRMMNYPEARKHIEENFAENE